MFKKQFMTVAAATLLAVLAASVARAETIKFALIEGLSGPFAVLGQNALREFQYAADVLVNEKGGVAGGNTIEFVGFDNKTSPKESLIQLENAISQGIRFIVQGNSSGVANAISEAVAKHNRRNPDNQVIYFNYAAVDPALTNEKCNFWHFRFDGNADMKMNAITNAILSRPDIKKVYVIGQNYSFGQAVAAAAHRYLAEK
ncbi:MAG: ABC transporter substrate-binding protein, partial [Fimbriimonadaceae bacterium]|nr:ABC transporter substrate-binding protein [Alphaproteobacteria bacterium]